MSRSAAAGKAVDNGVNVYVGRRIRVRRRTLGYSLDDLSVFTGISITMCSKYERGAAQIASTELFLISCVLGISVDLLFPANPTKLLDLPAPPSKQSVEIELYRMKETIELVKLYYKLPTKKLRNTVRSMMRFAALEAIAPPIPSSPDLDDLGAPAR